MVIENWLNRNRKVRYSIDEVSLQLPVTKLYIYLLEMGHKTCLTFSVMKTVLKLKSVVEKSHYSQCCILIFFTEMIRNAIITISMIIAKRW